MKSWEKHSAGEDLRSGVCKVGGGGKGMNTSARVANIQGKVRTPLQNTPTGGKMNVGGETSKRLKGNVPMRTQIEKRDR